MFNMACAELFYYHNISVIDFIGLINIGVSLTACLRVLFTKCEKWERSLLRRSDCIIYRKNGSTVPSGGG